MRRSSRLPLLLLLLAVYLCTACSDTVFVTVTAPEAWTGAEVTVDGRHATTLRRIDSSRATGAVGHFRVPTGSYDLGVELPGHRPIIRRLELSEAGEHYVTFTQVPERLGELG